MPKAGTFRCVPYGVKGCTENLCLRRVVANGRYGGYELCGSCERGARVFAENPERAEELKEIPRGKTQNSMPRSRRVCGCGRTFQVMNNSMVYDCLTCTELHAQGLVAV